MNVLEKILEEIENESKLAHEEMRRCARENPLQFDEVKGYSRAMEYVVDSIRSHMPKKEKVSSAEIISRNIDGKPYYEIKYKKVGEHHYTVVYGSYKLDYVINWLNECFEFCNESKICTNDILKQILEEIDNRKSYHEEKLYQRDDYEIQKMYCDEELDWIANIIRSHIDKSPNYEKCSGNNRAFVVRNMTAEQFKELTKDQNSFQKAMERFNRNKGCMVYEVDSNTMEDTKPVSREFLEECAEVAEKYKRNTEDNNKCSDCSRRKWYQIGYRDGENINIEKIKAINKEMEDYLFEKYCIEGFDEILDGIFNKYLELCKDINVPTNKGWISVEERLPEDLEKVLVWYEYFRYGEYNCMFETYGIGWQLDGHWSGDVSGTKARCIAWRPLPKPYKSKKIED